MVTFYVVGTHPKFMEMSCPEQKLNKKKNNKIQKQQQRKNMTNMTA
jgi:hypothetical protein